MNNEAAFKSVFKRSVRAHKGFALSLAAPMLSGLPDLYVCMKDYIPILLEAKWLKDINRSTFKRKLQFTEMQKNYIESCDTLNPYSAMGLIGLKYNDTIYACLVKWNTPLFDAFTHEFLTECSRVPYDKQTKTFNVAELFAKVPIPRIAQSKNEHRDDKIKMAV